MISLAILSASTSRRRRARNVAGSLMRSRRTATIESCSSAEDNASLYETVSPDTRRRRPRCKRSVVRDRLIQSDDWGISMLNRRETLMALGTLALSRPVRAQDRQTSNDDDLRKFGAAMDFSRTRKSADYAISTPTAIDEAKYPENRRHRAMGHDSWGGRGNPSCSSCMAAPATRRIRGDMPGSTRG